MRFMSVPPREDQSVLSEGIFALLEPLERSRRRVREQQEAATSIQVNQTGDF
jgi:hypothetical protein